MQKRLSFIALLIVLAVPAFGEAASKSKSLPALPFEQYFAGKRGDHDVLKFNDFSGKIKAHRIKKLLRSVPFSGIVFCCKTTPLSISRKVISSPQPHSLKNGAQSAASKLTMWPHPKILRLIQIMV